MKRKDYDGEMERTILTALIVNDVVLSRVCAKLTKEDEPFRSRWSNVIFGWCRKFNDKYGRAPGRALRSIYRNFARKSRDEETAELIGSFLEGLSRDYRITVKQINPDYMFDQTLQYFNAIKLHSLSEGIEADLSEGRDASSRVSSFAFFNQGTDTTTDFLTDVTEICSTIERKEEEVLIHYPGALGRFFGNRLSRDSFVAFQAPEKRGKTFFLMDLAWRSAIKCKRRTLFYSTGDLSQNQMYQRFISRASGRPMDAGEARIPHGIKKLEDGTCKLRSRKVVFAEPITHSEIRKALHMARMHTAHTTSLLRMKAVANSTLNVAGIRSEVMDFVRCEWSPDVIVIDYADILAPEPGASDEFRHRTDETWRALRRLAQEFHCLVVTATQANAASYDSSLMRRKHFSEDKRKMAHVTGFVGINQTDEEKRRDRFRLNWIVAREGVYTESSCVHVAGCLAVAHPTMVSTW